MPKRQKPARPIPRIALNQTEAAASLGMSVESFGRYVRPEVRVIRVGSMRLFRPADLEKWADEHAGMTLDEPR